nr:DPP IV N-terminal domain-containing protein [Nitritalea halalkaliphila]
MDSGSETDQYLPRIYWTADSQQLAYIRLNRLQNQLDFFYANPADGRSTLLLQEKAATYVDLNYNDNFLFLGQNKGFIRTSEQNGYKHIYHHANDGSLIRQLTDGPFEVNSLIGVDEKAGKLYFISSEASPLERHVYVVGLNGKGKKQLTTAKGTHRVSMSKDFRYFINYHSAADSPMTVTLHESNGKLLSTLEDNAALRERLKGFQLAPKEFFQLDGADGTPLNAYQLKPVNFDPNKQYPVLMFVYGGPGSSK